MYVGPYLIVVLALDGGLTTSLHLFLLGITCWLVVINKTNIP